MNKKSLGLFGIVLFTGASIGIYFMFSGQGTVSPEQKVISKMHAKTEPVLLLKRNNEQTEGSSKEFPSRSFVGWKPSAAITQRVKQPQPTATENQRAADKSTQQDDPTINNNHLVLYTPKTAVAKKLSKWDGNWNRKKLSERTITEQRMQIAKGEPSNFRRVERAPTTIYGLIEVAKNP